jgi:hypothetical protein
MPEKFYLKETPNGRVFEILFENAKKQLFALVGVFEVILILAFIYNVITSGKIEIAFVGITVGIFLIFYVFLRKLSLRITVSPNEITYEKTTFLSITKKVVIKKSQTPVLMYKKKGIFTGNKIIISQEQLYEASLEFDNKSLPFLDPFLRYFLSGSLSRTFVKNALFTLPEINKISQFLGLKKKEITETN